MGFRNTTVSMQGACRIPGVPPVDQIAFRHNSPRQSKLDQKLHPASILVNEEPNIVRPLMTHDHKLCK